MSVSRDNFGTMKDGRAVEIITLANESGVTARVLTLGAILQSLDVPDRSGRLADVVLGYDDVAGYLADPHYLGATVGRYANRIAGGRFTLDGRAYRLDTNDGPNHLHGGAAGLHRKLWSVEELTASPEPRLVLGCRSPDGEGGYPGNLDVTATFSLSQENALTIAYRVVCDRATIVNITNHSYYNLAGGGSVMEQRLTLYASAYTPVDPTLIPTGEVRSVQESPFDFRDGGLIGARIRDGGDAQLRIGQGYDHNVVIDGVAGTLRPAARLEDAASRRVMELLVTAPGLQFYSGNVLDGTIVGKRGRLYRQGDGLCLEPQLFPDAPNRPGFPSARLAPGEVCTNMMVLKFSMSAATGSAA